MIMMMMMTTVQKCIPVIFLSALLNIKYGCSFVPCKPKVAIIGAGIGGASASHFLTELFDKNIDIDIFEANTIGGRLATIKFGNEEFEAGGAIIHPRNKYMKDFVEMLNLQSRSPSGSRFGIWNGKEFVLEESDWESLTMLKLLYRYGMEPIYLHRYINSILNDFEKIYKYQDENVGFENVTALLSAMNKEFVDLLQVSMKDHMTNLGYGSRLINELIEATLVVNYGQNTNVQAFVSSVSVAGAGFDLWAVKGGNKEVPRNLISRNDRVSMIHSTVQKIIRKSEGNKPKYQIFSKGEGEQNTISLTYDIVIIAAPITKDQKHLIQFDGFNNSDLQTLGEYQTTYATFVKGSVNYSYFGLDEELGGILSCDPEKTIISSIGKLFSVEGTKDSTLDVWKIFSRRKLDEVLLNEMFLSVDDVKEIKWKAYPQYSSSLRLDKFKVDDFMYHVNAIEWAASAMEMSAIGGRNAAILAFNDFQQTCSLFTRENDNFVSEETIHSKEL